MERWPRSAFQFVAPRLRRSRHRTALAYLHQGLPAKGPDPEADDVLGPFGDALGYRPREVPTGRRVVLEQNDVRVLSLEGPAQGLLVPSPGVRRVRGMEGHMAGKRSHSPSQCLVKGRARGMGLYPDSEIHSAQASSRSGGRG